MENKFCKTRHPEKSLLNMSVLIHCKLYLGLKEGVICKPVLLNLLPQICVDVEPNKGLAIYQKFPSLEDSLGIILTYFEHALWDTMPTSTSLSEYFWSLSVKSLENVNFPSPSFCTFLVNFNSKSLFFTPLTNHFTPLTNYSYIQENYWFGNFFKDKKPRLTRSN